MQNSLCCISNFFPMKQYFMQNKPGCGAKIWALRSGWVWRSGDKDTWSETSRIDRQRWRRSVSGSQEKRFLLGKWTEKTCISRRRLESSEEVKNHQVHGMELRFIHIFTQVWKENLAFPYLCHNRSSWWYIPKTWEIKGEKSKTWSHTKAKSTNTWIFGKNERDRRGSLVHPFQKWFLQFWGTWLIWSHRGCGQGSPLETLWTLWRVLAWALGCLLGQ